MCIEYISFKNCTLHIVDVNVFHSAQSLCAQHLSRSRYIQRATIIMTMQSNAKGNIWMRESIRARVFVYFNVTRELIIICWRGLWCGGIKPLSLTNNLCSLLCVRPQQVRMALMGYIFSLNVRTLQSRIRDACFTCKSQFMCLFKLCCYSEMSGIWCV